MQQSAQRMRIAKERLKELNATMKAEAPANAGSGQASPKRSASGQDQFSMQPKRRRSSSSVSSSLSGGESDDSMNEGL